jgi:hypothetical protein
MPYLRPNSDVSNPGGWVDQAGGTTNLYSTIDEVTADDTDYNKGPNCPTNAAMTVGLQSGTDPESSSGHVVHFRARHPAGSVPATTLTVSLLQNGTLISSLAQLLPISNTWVDYSFTLTGSEADSITDYSQLQLKFNSTRSTACLGSPHSEVSYADLLLPVPPGKVFATIAITSTVAGVSVNNATAVSIVIISSVDTPTVRVHTTHLVGLFGLNNPLIRISAQDVLAQGYTPVAGFGQVVISASIVENSLKGQPSFSQVVISSPLIIENSLKGQPNFSQVTINSLTAQPIVVKTAKIPSTTIIDGLTIIHALAPLRVVGSKMVVNPVHTEVAVGVLLITSLVQANGYTNPLTFGQLIIIGSVIGSQVSSIRRVFLIT